MLSKSETKWAHLPNALHIDRVLDALKLYPECWAKPGPTWDRGWKTSWEDSVEVRRSTEWIAVHAASWQVSPDVVWLMGLASLMCLVAHDDCAHMIDSEVGELKILAALGDQKAMLLLPACMAFHSIKELA